MNTTIEIPIPPLLPGEILLEEFLIPLGVSYQKLSGATNFPTSLICDIVRGDSDITPEIAKELSDYFGTSAAFWINLQEKYNVDIDVFSRRCFELEDMYSFKKDRERNRIRGESEV